MTPSHADVERARDWLATHPRRAGYTLALPLAELIAAVRAESFERAARECDDRAVLNDAVENETDMATDPQTEVRATACGHRAIEARECAYAIRALGPEKGAKP